MLPLLAMLPRVIAEVRNKTSRLPCFSNSQTMSSGNISLGRREEHFYGQPGCRNLPYNFPLWDSMPVASYENAVCLGLTQHFNLVWLESFFTGHLLPSKEVLLTSPPVRNTAHRQLIFPACPCLHLPCGSLYQHIMGTLKSTCCAFSFQERLGSLWRTNTFPVSSLWYPQRACCKYGSIWLPYSKSPT